MAKQTRKQQISIKHAQERNSFFSSQRHIKAAQSLIHSLNLPAGVSEQMGDYCFSHWVGQAWNVMGFYFFLPVFKK